MPSCHPDPHLIPEHIFRPDAPALPPPLTSAAQRPGGFGTPRSACSQVRLRRREEKGPCLPHGPQWAHGKDEKRSGHSKEHGTSVMGSVLRARSRSHAAGWRRTGAYLLSVPAPTREPAFARGEWRVLCKTCVTPASPAASPNAFSASELNLRRRGRCRLRASCEDPGPRTVWSGGGWIGDPPRERLLAERM